MTSTPEPVWPDKNSKVQKIAQSGHTVQNIIFVGFDHGAL